MADEAARASPWLSIWFRPRAAIEAVRAKGMWWATGLLLYFNLLPAVLLLGSPQPALAVLRGAALSWLPLGIAAAAFSATLAWIVARGFGGRGTLRDVIMAFAWTSLPAIVLGLAGLFAAEYVPLLGLRVGRMPSPPIAIVVAFFVGVVWSLVIFVPALGRVMQLSFAKAVIVVVIFVVLTLAVRLAIRMVIIQPFNIPATSMHPAVLVGDYLFVSKYSYGYSRFSFSYGIASFAGRVWPREPQMGDVVVFRNPMKPDVDYIKRVIGLPGEEIEMREGVLHINGAPVPTERVEDFEGPDGDGGTSRKPMYIETLPGGFRNQILDEGPDGVLDTTTVHKVPAGHYFVMGDNRDNSVDSRMMGDMGFVPFEYLIGRAEFVFFSEAKTEPTTFYGWLYQGLGGDRFLKRVR